MRNRAEIHERLNRLRRRDRKHRVFGSAAHDFRLNRPIDVRTIASFEQHHGIALPEDYRLFITEIGNGGAGPAYGLFPFGRHDDSVGLCPWDGSDLVGDFGSPFPHSEAWNLEKSFWDDVPQIPDGMPLEEETRLWDEWDRIDREHYWNPALVNGAIPICHLGCALRQWLIVNGDQRGYVWNDFRADCRGLLPLLDEAGRPQSFEDWYLNWLAAAERETTLRRRLVASVKEIFG